MNIVLIGFKACGKSTIGLRLARLAGMDFVDTDALAEDNFFQARGERLSSREIYSRFGESFWRDLETDAVRGLSLARGAVIATGGGIILRAENPPLLRAAGLCVFLDVPLPVLEKRLENQALSPLFRARGVAAVYRERLPLYLAAAHLRYAARGNEDARALARGLSARIREEKYGQ
ncbi:MAG: hypothetical protein LBO77_02570 [Desulfovibrio sp.]|jgi:shikimate kinase|nr:hypothetical protein [Desulfovibrio sp.]